MLAIYEYLRVIIRELSAKQPLSFLRTRVRIAVSYKKVGFIRKFF